MNNKTVLKSRKTASRESTELGPGQSGTGQIHKTLELTPASYDFRFLDVTNQKSKLTITQINLHFLAGQDF
jgi:hypothetical protein